MALVNHYGSEHVEGQYHGPIEVAILAAFFILSVEVLSTLGGISTGTVIPFEMDKTSSLTSTLAKKKGRKLNVILD